MVGISGNNAKNAIVAVLTISTSIENAANLTRNPPKFAKSVTFLVAGSGFISSDFTGKVFIV